MSASNKPAVSDVTVCAAESLLTTLTCAPGDTVMLDGNFSPSMVICAEAVAGDAVAEAVVADADRPDEEVV
jgi:hypothetical protein